ncbi:MAG: RluA family pseudouridine synthase [Candidatus Rokubacteria bacterium]|nr:RluA family pseudouridine synthase [Candidatus Rokubacteria bacterium]
MGEEGSPARFAATVTAAEAGARLDRWLAAHVAAVSRRRLQAMVGAGQVRVDGRVRKAAYRLRADEIVEAEIPAPPLQSLAPEPLPLRIVLEDPHLLVIDKPAGMVTHPGAGRSEGTLAAAALAHAPEIATVGGARRPGIVHRLDKGTSGLLVLAKTPAAYDALTAQLARRSVSRRYLCLVRGRLARDAGAIDAPIARDPRSRVRMAVASPGRGKRAVTRFRVLERFAEASYLECRLETGRTHQIRVHLASLGHPVLGDDTYGRPPSGQADPVLEARIAALGGLALHAAVLSFTHPATGDTVEVTAPLPERIERVLSCLRAGV